MEKINCINCFNPTDAIKIKIINEYPHPPSLNSVKKKKKTELYKLLEKEVNQQKLDGITEK